MDAELIKQPAPYRCKHGCERNAMMDRIAELEAKLATAERDALERAAVIADVAHGNWSDCARRFPGTIAIEASAEAAEAIAATIRAAKEQGNG